MFRGLTIEQILTAIGIVLGAFAILFTGVKSIIGLLSPFKKIIERVGNAEDKLKNDYEQIGEIKKDIKDIDEYNKMICKTLMVMTGHLVSGNDICKLKEQYSELQEYLINK